MLSKLFCLNFSIIVRMSVDCIGTKSIIHIVWAFLKQFNNVVLRLEDDMPLLMGFIGSVGILIAERDLYEINESAWKIIIWKAQGVPQ